MKLTLQEDFIRQMAEKEEGVSVTAGALNTEAFYHEVECQKAMSLPPESAFTAVLGRFLNLARRERSLTLEQLAEATDSSAIDLFLMEEGKKTPEPLVVSKLARTLNVPPGSLMQLAGHVQVLDQKVATAAYAFAASANSKPLEPEERQALHEFVKALASG